MQYQRPSKFAMHLATFTLLSPLVFTGIFIAFIWQVRLLRAEQAQLTRQLDVQEQAILILNKKIELMKEATPSAEPVEATEPEPVEEVEIQLAPVRVQEAKAVWTGKVSHYSRAGCLGCSANLTMANGQPLDDSKMTIAFNKLPLNTRVRLTNLDTGVSVEAVVTDTGGFERHGRIADLVPAVANALGTKTDLTNVQIEAI